MQSGFGSGLLFGTPKTDYAGNAISNPTPILFGIIQDISVDLSFDVKELFGQNQFPVDVARGKGKIQCKAKMAQIFGLMYGYCFFGQSVSNGGYSNAYDTAGQAIPATPYQITITPPNSGTFAADLGVVDSNGLPMIRVASAPATGQYSVAAGVYTFAAADTGKQVFINYQYTFTSSTAKVQTITNPVMGYAPTFQADLLMTHSGKSLALTLFSCTSTKLSLPTKLDDYLVQEFDFSAFANPAGQVLKLGTSD